MSKKQIVRIAGIAAAVIFAMGALFPILSIDFLGTSMSKSLIDTADWIFVMLNAVLIIVNVLLSEEISLDICALTAVFITIGELKPFFDGSLGEASSFVKKGFGFYCLLIGTILIVIVAVAHWFIKPSKGKTKKLKKPESRKCPYCAETIKVDALICRFCGSKLDPLPELEPEPTANDEDDNSWKGVAKAGGQLLLTIVMGFISLALCGFVIACVLVSSSGQEEQPDNSSQISEMLKPRSLPLRLPQPPQLLRQQQQRLLQQLPQQPRLSRKRLSTHPTRMKHISSRMIITQAVRSMARFRIFSSILTERSSSSAICTWTC